MLGSSKKLNILDFPDSNPSHGLTNRIPSGNLPSTANYNFREE